MRWWRMVMVAWRIAWPYVLCPWRSELVRWRIETFGLIDEQGQPMAASRLTPRQCLAFMACRRRELLRFLRWAAELSRS